MKHIILYSAYISRVFNFTNFVNLESFVKFIQLKFEQLIQSGAWATHIREMFSMNSFKTVICENLDL